MTPNNKINSQQLIARVKAAVASAVLVGTMAGWLVFGSQSQTASTVVVNSVDPAGSVDTPTITLPTQATTGNTSTSASTSQNTISSAGSEAATNQNISTANTDTTSSTNQSTTTTTGLSRQRGAVTTTRSSK